MRYRRRGGFRRRSFRSFRGRRGMAGRRYGRRRRLRLGRRPRAIGFRM